MCKIFHSSAKLIVNDSDIDKAFRPMYQSAMMKKKFLISKMGLLKRSLNMILRILSVNIVRSNSVRKWR